MKTIKYKYSRKQLDRAIVEIEFSYEDSPEQPVFNKLVKLRKMLLSTLPQEDKPCRQCLNPDEKGICTCGRNWYFNSSAYKAYSKSLLKLSTPSPVEEIEWVGYDDGGKATIEMVLDLSSKLNEVIKIVNSLSKK